MRAQFIEAQVWAAQRDEMLYPRCRSNLYVRQPRHGLLPNVKVLNSIKRRTLHVGHQHPMLILIHCQQLNKIGRMLDGQGLEHIQLVCKHGGERFEVQVTAAS